MCRLLKDSRCFLMRLCKPFSRMQLCSSIAPIPSPQNLPSTHRPPFASVATRRPPLHAALPVQMNRYADLQCHYSYPSILFDPQPGLPYHSIHSQSNRPLPKAVIASPISLQTQKGNRSNPSSMSQITAGTNPYTVQSSLALWC
jgi:hypothetical protein